MFNVKISNREAKKCTSDLFLSSGMFSLLSITHFKNAAPSMQTLGVGAAILVLTVNEITSPRVKHVLCGKYRLLKDLSSGLGQDFRKQILALK